MWRSTLIRRITTGTLSNGEFCRWMECWIPQVREGTVWMRRAVDNLDAAHDGLRALISQHASEEQFDYRMLFDDYRKAGGGATHIDALRRNAGGEALNAYMHARARSAIRSGCWARSTSSRAPASASSRRCCRCCGGRRGSPIIRCASSAITEKTIRTTSRAGSRR
jgi:hypothetical protein